MSKKVFEVWNDCTRVKNEKVYQQDLLSEGNATPQSEEMQSLREQIQKLRYTD